MCTCEAAFCCSNQQLPPVIKDPGPYDEGEVCNSNLRSGHCALTLIYAALPMPERARLPPTLLIIVGRGTQLVDDAATAALAAVRISYIAIRIGVCWDLSNSNSNVTRASIESSRRAASAWPRSLQRPRPSKSPAIMPIHAVRKKSESQSRVSDRSPNLRQDFRIHSEPEALSPRRLPSPHRLHGSCGPTGGRQ